MKRKIARIRDRELTYLVYEGNYSADEVVPLGKPTVEEYADLCDQQAENENAHDFCGTHKALLDKVLRPNVASPKALLNIMRDIAEAGGLQRIDE